MGVDTRTSVRMDPLLALLHVDQNLGCCPEGIRHIRGDINLRRMVAERHVRPSLRRQTFLVDYDDPAHRRLDAAECCSIDPSLTINDFPISRTGRGWVEMIEIFFEWTLNTRQHLRLIESLTWRQPCLAETRTVLAAGFHDGSDRVISHCGRIDDDERVPSLLRVPDGIILTRCRWNDRWRHRILAVPEVCE